MSFQDEAFVQRMLSAWNAHDVERAMAMMAEDCLWEVTRGAEPHGTLVSGAAAVRDAVADLFRAIPDIHYRPLRSAFGPDLVVMELQVTGTLADGNRANFNACDVLTMRDGKIAAKRSYRKIVG